MTTTLAPPFRKFRTGLVFLISIALFLLIVFWDRCVINIPAGHAGVMWWRFFGGTDVTSPAKAEGIRIIFPWDDLFIYDMRLQSHEMSYDVISREGLAIKVSASVRWRLIPNTLGKLHKSIGPQYLEKLLVPEIGSILRAKIASEEAEAFYSHDRPRVQEDIYKGVAARENRNGIGARQDIGLDIDPTDMLELVDILIRQVDLPDSLKQAINRKLQEAELVKEYRFKIETEKLESQRKEVEASGIKKFQDIVTPGMSDNYLRWQGISATLALARAPNGKLVIMGNGPGGLPVILNGFEGSSSLGPNGKTPAASKDVKAQTDPTPQLPAPMVPK